MNIGGPDFTIGRDDFGVTVYVPWNCNNNCKFCNSKQDYNKIEANFEEIKKALIKIHDSLVPIVTFTGGEPSADVEKLKQLVAIVSNKIVYINTTLPRENAIHFIDFVNNTACVKSISISRHKTNYESDCEMFNDISDDEMILKIQKPIRINVVETEDDRFSPENMEKYVARWIKLAKIKKDYNSIILNLRTDYTKQDKILLHDLENNGVINYLATAYFYDHHTFCDVCDTCVFYKMAPNKEIEFAIHYHRGLATTSVNFGNICEINDLIVLQNGEICYDWNRKKENLDRLLNLLEIK